MKKVLPLFQRKWFVAATIAVLTTLSSCVLLLPEQKAIITFQNGDKMETSCRTLKSQGAGCYECDGTEWCGVRNVCYPCR